MIFIFYLMIEIRILFTMLIPIGIFMTAGCSPVKDAQRPVDHSDVEQTARSAVGRNISVEFSSDVPFGSLVLTIDRTGDLFGSRLRKATNLDLEEMFKMFHFDTVYIRIADGEEASVSIESIAAASSRLVAAYRSIYRSNPVFIKIVSKSLVGRVLQSDRDGKRERSECHSPKHFPLIAPLIPPPSCVVV